MGLEFRVNILHRNDEKLVSINLHLYKWIIRTSRKSADIRNSSKQPINASTRVSDIKPELRTERRSKKRESRNIRVGVRLIYRSTILVYVLPETANTSLAFSSRIIEKLLPGSGNCGRKTFRRRDPGPPPPGSFYRRIIRHHSPVLWAFCFTAFTHLFYPDVK